MSTPDWLRPVSERYLGGDLGPPPPTVRVATALAAGNALATGSLAVGAGVLTVRILTEPPVVLANLLASALPGLVLAVTGAVFAASTVQLIRRGWYRSPTVAGWTVTALTLLGICVAIEPSLATAEQPQRDWSITGSVLPWLLSTAALAIALVLVLRTESASNWLARRRHQHRTGGAPT